MLITITTTHRPATDLGYLLHKNPERHQTAQLGFGTLHVLYPEASDERCTAALARMFGTAMSGRCKERPELAAQPIPIVVQLPVVPCRGGEVVLRQLFEPLGYQVPAEPISLDNRFPDWGDSRYLDVSLAATVKLKDVLEHLFVLLPVLDDDKHYWVGRDEVDKLVRRGGEWLAAHPSRELIAHRYLRHDRQLTRDALARLLEDDAGEPDSLTEARDAEEDAVEVPLSLNERRMAAVVGVIRASGARRVLDLGCGSARLVGVLMTEPGLERVVGVDVSHRPSRSEPSACTSRGWPRVSEPGWISCTGHSPIATGAFKGSTPPP